MSYAIECQSKNVSNKFVSQSREWNINKKINHNWLHFFLFVIANTPTPNVVVAFSSIFHTYSCSSHTYQRIWTLICIVAVGNLFVCFFSVFISRFICDLQLSAICSYQRFMLYIWSCVVLYGVAFFFLLQTHTADVVTKVRFLSLTTSVIVNVHFLIVSSSEHGPFLMALN